MLLDYGFRSKCCYAPIRMGRKKVKQTNTTVNIWICCKCGKRDVDLLEYTKDGIPASTRERASFAEREVDRHDEM